MLSERRRHRFLLWPYGQTIIFILLIFHNIAQIWNKSRVVPRVGKNSPYADPKNPFFGTIPRMKTSRIHWLPAFSARPGRVGSPAAQWSLGARCQGPEAGKRGHRFPMVWYGLPSGKRLHNYGKSQCLVGKPTISMTIFQSYMKFPEGNRDDHEIIFGYYVYIYIYTGWWLSLPLWKK